MSNGKRREERMGEEKMKQKERGGERYWQDGSGTRGEEEEDEEGGERWGETEGAKSSG